MRPGNNVRSHGKSPSPLLLLLLCLLTAPLSHRTAHAFQRLRKAVAKESQVKVPSQQGQQGGAVVVKGLGERGRAPSFYTVCVGVGGWVAMAFR